MTLLNEQKYYSSPLMRSIQIFLLILIVIGIGLLLIKNIWVPRLVEYILKNENRTETEVSSRAPSFTTETATTSEKQLKTSGKVDGLVTIGPTCPVIKSPPDGACDDKPFKTTLLIVSNTQSDKSFYLVSTDDNGYFFKDLVPGNYTIKAKEEAVMPSLSPVIFDVVTEKTTHLTLQFDSGIR